MSSKQHTLEFVPSLDQIPEELNNSLGEDSIDLTLNEYAILTDEDLRKALYLDSSDEEEKKETKDIFSSLHSSASLKNQTIIHKNSTSDAKNDFEGNSEVSDDYEQDHDNVFDSQDPIVDDERKNALPAKLDVSHPDAFPGKNVEDPQICQNGKSDHKTSVFLLSEVFNPNLVDFNSANGKHLFSQSIQKKYMNIYYCLSQYLRSNPSDDSFYGCFQILFSIVKKSKSVRKDFDSMWEKGNFIDFLYGLHKENISFESYIVWKSSSQNLFRKAVKISSMSTDIILVCCYWDVTAQANSFSIVGGYHKEKDMVLLFDVVSSRIPSKWIKLNDIWNHMLNNYKNYQGYVSVNIGENRTLSVTEDIVVKFKLSNAYMIPLYWQNGFAKWLDSPRAHENNEQVLNDSLLQLTQMICRGPVLADAQIPDPYIMNELLNIFKGTKIYSLGIVFVASLSSEEKKYLTNYFVNCLYALLLTSHQKIAKKKSFRKSSKKKTLPSFGGNNLALFLSMIILFWDYNKISPDEEVNDEEMTNRSILIEFQSQEKNFIDDHIELGKFSLASVLKMFGIHDGFGGDDID